MAATYAVQVTLGASPGSYSTLTNARLRTDDTNTQDLTSPCLIDSVIRYSYWKSISLNFSGTFTQVSNIRHYTDATTWTWGTAGGLLRGNRDSGDKGAPHANYNQATGTPGVTGNQIATSHTYFSGQTTPTTNLLLDTSGSPALIDSTLYVAPGNSNDVVIQVKVDTDGTQGVQTAKTNTFVVDEI